MNRELACYALLAMFAGCGPLLASNASAEDKAAEQPADLENPASLAPGYDTLNKAKNKLDSMGDSIVNAKHRFDEFIGVRPKPPDYSDPNYEPESAEPAAAGPAASASPTWTPPTPTPQEALNNRKRMLDIMSAQSQKDAADYAAMQAQCGNGPESREECLKNLKLNYDLRHSAPLGMMPEDIERMRVQGGMPAKIDAGTSGDPLLRQMFDDQSSQAASANLQGIMDDQQKNEAAQQDALRRQQEERQRQLAEQERQRQAAAQQRALADQQAQQGALEQAQRDADNAAQMQNVLNAFSMGVNAAAAARRAAPVPRYVPPASMPSYQGTTSAPSYNTYTPPSPAPASSGYDPCPHGPGGGCR